MNRKEVLAIVLILTSVILVSASFEKGDPSNDVLTTYIKDSFLSGWINISFNDTSLDSKFTDTFGNEVKLEELLGTNENSQLNYECTIQDCSSTYSASSPSEGISYNMQSNSTDFFGLKFTGQIETIDSISFTFNSNAAASCDNQIKLDILNDGEIDAWNNKSSTTLCEAINQGCYEGSESGGGLPPGGTAIAAIYDPEEILIGTTPLCQKINFTESNGFKIGAWIREKTAGTSQVMMSLYSLGGNKISECNLSKATMGSVGVHVSCDANYSIQEPTENYVCVKTSEGTGEYKTQGYAPNEGACGFFGYPPGEETSAYDIFVQNKKFNSPGTISVSNNLQNGKNFASIVQEYITENYGSLDCSDGCVVPIKIISSLAQTVNLNNLVIYYSKTGLPGLEENDFYEVEEISSGINANFQKLYLDGKFSLNQLGEKNYVLSLEGTEIFNKGLIIKDISMSLNPQNVVAEVPTEFKVEFSPEQNVESYYWDFGDGNYETTNNSFVNHKYSQINNYTMKITAQTEDNESLFKSFEIVVESPEKIINSTIIDLRKEIGQLETKIEEKFPTDSFSVSAIKSTLKLDYIKNRLDELEGDAMNATSDEEFINIAEELYSFEIPDSISNVEVPALIYVMERDLIDLNTISEITGESYNPDLEEAYLDALVYWGSVEAGIKIKTNQIILYKDEIQQKNIGVFEVTFDNFENDLYFVSPELEDLFFEENASTIGQYTYLPITSNNFKFSTSEILSQSELPVIIFPELSKLGVIDDNYEPPVSSEKKSPLKWILLALVLVIAGVVYFVLYRWYKNKYESKLFPDKNNLYNLGHYIHNEKRKGTPNSKIRDNLRKAKWSGEQITYAMKKYYGKNTGMFSFSGKKDEKVNK